MVAAIRARRAQSPSTQAPVRIGIAGLGPRGLTILERLLALAPHAPQRRYEIVVFEPNEPGVGVHSRTQPAYLMLNTVAGQLSMFPDQAALDGLPARTGPGFYDWCRMRGIRVNDNGTLCENGGRPVDPSDFLPRRLLGDYLSWCYRYLVKHLPANVTLQLKPHCAVRATPRRDARGLLVRDGAGAEEAFDRLFVTLGHTGKKRAAARSAREIARPYPLPASVAGIEPGATVAVSGFGLAAMDVIAALTIGRGGRHLGDPARADYHRSGAEPRIVLYSRSGHPYFARPDGLLRHQKHRALFLTATQIGTMRRHSADGRLDFEREVMPLMLDEMRAACYLCHAALATPGQVANLRARLMEARALGCLDGEFAALAQRFGGFDPAACLAATAPPGLEGAAYTDWVRDTIQADLDLSVAGVAHSPVKAALEVWRDLRDTLRDLVNHDGLGAVSAARFHASYGPVINRLVAGPQKERHQDLLALMRAGVVEVFPGRAPQLEARADGAGFALVAGEHRYGVDYVVRAHVDAAGLQDTDSALLASLREQGIVDGVATALGVDAVNIDARAHPLGQHEAAAQAIWVFGPNVEGATYYNHYVPSAGAWSRAWNDAHRAAAACLGIDTAALTDSLALRESA